LNKKILILLSKVTKKDMDVIYPLYWFIVRILVIILLIYYKKEIIFFFDEIFLIIKAFVKELIDYKTSEVIIIQPEEPLQGNENLNLAYRKCYLLFFGVFYHIYREFIIFYEKNEKKKK
jgi:hypothetical protein